MGHLRTKIEVRLSESTMGQNRKKHRMNNHLIIHYGVSKVSKRASERSEGRERSEQSGASKRVSGASERANGRASGPVLTSVFLVILAHCEVAISIGGG